MKKNFEYSLELLLKHEGGFVDHPKDPGGMTNLGVTRAAYEQYMKGPVTEAEMRALTPKIVAPFYKTEYWDKGRLDDMPSGLDFFCFDWGVNSGMGRPAKVLQRILGVTADGAIGPKTIKACFDFEADSLVVKMYDARQKFYENLSTFPTFGKGWTRRNKEALEQALELIEE